MRLNGKYYQVNGTKRGPAPTHDFGIWVGAYKPRILKPTGHIADGWLSSLQYLPGGSIALEEMHKHIGEGAVSVGRDPSDVRRFLNISGQFARSGRSLLVGLPQQWAEEFAGITLEYGVTGFILMTDDASSNSSQPKSPPQRVNSSPSSAPHRATARDGGCTLPLIRR